MPYRRLPEAEVPSLAGWDGSTGKQHSVNFPSSNRWGFPDVKRYLRFRGLPTDLVAYNDLGRMEYQSGRAAHFFLQDNKFEAVWTQPKRAIQRLRETTDFVLGPDFSHFTDYPLVVQQYNKYRNHWCMALWQAEGFAVIPNVSWSDEASFEWAFAGMPQRSVVSVGTLGCVLNRATRDTFLIGYKEMVRQLAPTNVVVYGKLLPEMQSPGVKLHAYDTTWTKLAKPPPSWEEIEALDDPE